MLGLVLAFSAAADAAPLGHDSRALGLQIRVAPDGWGIGAQRLEPVLYAVADELVSLLPAKLSVPIVVAHTTGNPVALYSRGPAGEYLVRLHASGASWALYVYEFAHELCHVLSNHDEHAETLKHNQWFEETLCETASLYALQAVAQTWELSAVPEQAAAAPRLRRFYDALLAERNRELPAGATLARWLGEHEPQLRNNPYVREKNDLVAKQLLPFFQQDSRRWRALAYLNLDAGDATAPLNDYLEHWNDRAPTEHRGFISDVRALVAPPTVQMIAAAPSAVAPGAAGSALPSAGPVRERPALAPDFPLPLPNAGTVTRTGQDR